MPGVLEGAECMLLQKGAVNYCGCISRIEGAYIRIVGASAPTKRYKITPLPLTSRMGPLISFRDLQAQLEL